MLPMAQNDCFLSMSQDYLICTTVHKARQLGVFTGETSVRITLDKAHRTTKPYARSENPFYNEYFVFEIRCTLTELLRLTVLYEVRKRNACKKTMSHGELLIDLQSVWNQPNRCFFKKWGRLEASIADVSNNTPGAPKGYLQIDLAIVTQNSDPNTVLRPNDDMLELNRWQINQDYDNIERNMLQNADNSMQCNIRYNVTLYKAVLTKKSDYLIQVSFAGNHGKTNVCKSTTQPEWNHSVCFSWTYPSLSQTFVVQILSHEHLQWKTIADYEIHFDEIAFKDKPALGPTYVHFYDISNPLQYLGRLLVEVVSECLPSGPARDLLTKPVAPLDEKRWWQEETFLVEFLPLQGDFLHGNFSNCKITMKLAENSSNYVECFLKSYAGKHNNTGNSLKYFRQEAPYKAVYLKITMPDNRYKFDSDYYMQEILDLIESELATFKLFQIKYTNQFVLQAKCFKAIIMHLQSKLKEGVEDKRLEYTGFKETTMWDANRLVYINSFFEKFPEKLRAMRHKLKTSPSILIESTIAEVVDQMVLHSNELKSLLATTRLQDEWPTLFIMLSASGRNDIAVCRLNGKYFLNAPRDKSASPNSLCWRTRNFIFKDIQCQHSCINCGCNVGIIQGSLGIVVDSERTEYLASITNDWKQTELYYWSPIIHYTVYKCRVFIHQAKIRPGSDTSGLCDGYLRVIFGSQWAQTSTAEATLSPIWNCVICFDVVVFPGSLQWYMKNPPLVAVELYDHDRLTANDYVGCGSVPVSVISMKEADDSAREEAEGKLKPNKMVKTRTAMQKYQKLKVISPPPLTWVPIAQNGGVRAEVLMSAELVETTEEIGKLELPDPTITMNIPTSIRPIMKNFVLEVVFIGFRNYTKTTFGGRHRIKVMMGDLLLTSGLSSTRLKNSINFLVIFASGVVSLPEQLEYWPAIIATDVSVSSKGAETTLGAVLIPDSKRFLQVDKTVKCIPATPDEEGTTMLQIGDYEDNETQPLLHRDKPTLFQRTLDVFKRSKDLTKLPPIDNTDLTKIIDETQYSWWTKYYNSIYTYQETGDLSHLYKQSLIIYPNELERQADLDYLHDWAEPVKLVHGVKYKKNAMPKEETYATLKLNIKLVPCKCGTNDGGDGIMLRPLAAALNPRYQAELHTLTDLTKIIVRVYVIQGVQLRPHDKNSKSDAYVRLHLGGKTVVNRAHYVPNESNPVFGKCFQMDAVLPRDNMLEVSVFDRNLFTDDYIGSTYIDLEDRWRTKHGAAVGISKEYSKTGYNKWRNMATPFEILSELCSQRDLPAPKFVENRIEVDGVKFKDETRLALAEELQERLSLTALHHLDQLPSFCYKLVPEHVETRTLYRRDCPGIEQGKIQLWVELYEGNLNIPPPIDITPHPPQAYELRVVIYGCSDIMLDERNIFGKKMSDIGVKGWCADKEQSQATDIHYRSFDGEAAFNWRMLFPIKYSANEDMMVIKVKSGILNEYEVKHPPILYLQVWDNDFITKNEFLGMLELNLSNFPEPCTNKRFCALTNEFAGIKLPEPLARLHGITHRRRPPVNLFAKKRIRGWFPLHGQIDQISKDKRLKEQMRSQTGKIEIELEMLTEAEAAANAVGIGRNPPNALAIPSRPDTSFNPLTNPLKSFQKILLPVLIKGLIILGVSALVILVLVQFFSNLPFKLLGLR
ncbi:otoferlin isoform X1 [Zeugodacus cucurbitae]|uniref:otoferlin isoform X1 n=1 Tax=Zeugodacus cucurbitae TaxID=28588 RepID=UPI0023D95A4E|nr:otoferlin isoform X1 [Zeugodacus cucurbitae]